MRLENKIHGFTILDKANRIIAFASLLLVVCNYFVHTQHGVTATWEPAILLPNLILELNK
jgi:hypothetical protein